MCESERGYADPVDAFESGARVGGNKVPAGEGCLPASLLGKGDEVANLVDSSFTGKRVERPPLLRGNDESSCSLDLGVSVSAFPHLKPTATAWPGGGGVGHLHSKERRAGAAVWLQRGAWLGGAVLGARAPVPRLRRAAPEAQAPVA